jgi:prevent-host-death family protein
MVARTMSVSEARAALSEVVDRVAAGDEVVLTRHGAAVAVVVRPDALRSRRADDALAVAERIHELISSARAKPLRERPEISEDRAQAHLAELRAARASR